MKFIVMLKDDIQINHVCSDTVSCEKFEKNTNISIFVKIEIQRDPQGMYIIFSF